MIMTKHHHNNSNNNMMNNNHHHPSINPYRKTMLLILTLFMTWTSTYKLFSKFQYDISTITATTDDDDKDSSSSKTTNTNTRPLLRTSKTTRSSLRINQSDDITIPKKKHKSGKVRVKKSSLRKKKLPLPEATTIEKKKKNHSTSDLTKVMETNTFDDENMELDMNHGR